MMGVGDDGEMTVRHSRRNFLPVVLRHWARAGAHVQRGTLNSWQQWPAIDWLAQHRTPINLLNPFALAFLTKRIKRNLPHYSGRRCGNIWHRAKYPLRSPHGIKTARSARSHLPRPLL